MRYAHIYHGSLYDVMCTDGSDLELGKSGFRGFSVPNGSREADKRKVSRIKLRQLGCPCKTSGQESLW